MKYQKLCNLNFYYFLTDIHIMIIIFILIIYDFVKIRKIYKLIYIYIYTIELS